MLSVCSFLLLSLLTISGAMMINAQESADRRPVLFLIGDSTVKNSTRGFEGWGSRLEAWFDPAKVRIENRALGGRSSRSFRREGLWEKVLAEIQPGDFVLIQFGHNDNGPIEAGKARASLKGSGDETQDVTLESSGVQETVRTYGAYLRQYIVEAKAKGATPVVCSLVPRNIWRDGKVLRAAADFGKWAREAAETEGAVFLDLNEIVAEEYERVGQETVQREYFTTTDHTHTTRVGAEVSAAAVARGLRALEGCALASFLIAAKS